MATAARQLTFRQVFQAKPFRRLWLGQVISLFGDFLAVFAVFSLISFRWHGTPAQVTGVMISFMLPLAFFSPVAGVFVDRWNIKATMIASDLTRGALCLLLLFAREPFQVYAIFFVLSIVSSFFIPAQSVTLRAILPKEGLLAANAMMQQAMQVVRIISPALAGALVSALGERSCFWLDSFSFVFSAAMIGLIAIDRKPAAGAQTLRAILNDLGAGMRFIFGHATVAFVIISMTAGMFAISCYSALTAVYVRDILRGNSMLFGGMSSLIGVGMIAGTLAVRRFAMERSKTHMVVVGMLGNGVGILALAAFPTVAAAAAGTVIVGVSVAFIIVAAQTILQQETPMELVGRVSSSAMSLIAFAQVISLAFAGEIARIIGILNLYYISAAMLLVVAAVGYLRLQNHPAAAQGGSTAEALPTED